MPPVGHLAQYPQRDIKSRRSGNRLKPSHRLGFDFAGLVQPSPALGTIHTFPSSVWSSSVFLKKPRQNRIIEEEKQ
jgi:hypothetical protein